MDNQSILECDVFELADRLFDAYPEAIPFDDFGPYRLIEPIGKGGMGEVYLAEDEITGRRVAIKFLSVVSPEPHLRERFTREVKTLARLEHPFIARLYDAGLHPSGMPYFAMEYVQGKPLDAFYRERACSLEERIRLFRSICEAVQYAHSRLIVHRDLKPSNILVDDNDTPRLLDFGIARQLEDAGEPVEQTRTQAAFTRAYAAPEQLRREPIGVYTDVYALGVILYELLAGDPPYDVQNCSPLEAENLIAGENDPVKPSLRANRVAASKTAWNDLDVLCFKAMRKDIGRRYPSVTELIQDIDRYLKGEPLKARPESLRYRTGRFIARNRRSLAITAASLTAVLVLVAFFTVRLERARKATLAEAARTERAEQFLIRLLEGNDENNGPSKNLRVVDILDNGVREARGMKQDPAFQAELYQTLGSIFDNLGNYELADSLLDSAVRLRQQLGDAKKRADAMAALAVLRIDQEKLPEAEKLLRAALATYAGDSAARAAMGGATAALGSVYEERGDYAKAIETLNQALSLQTGPDAISDRAETLTVLGGAHIYLGHYSVAESIIRQTVAIYQRIYGPDHIRVGGACIDLGHIEQNLGNYAEAERQYRLALGIYQSWYGQDSTLTAMPESYVAQAVDQQGRYKEGKALLEHALLLVQKGHGDNERRIGFIMSDLALVAFKTGDLNGAEADYTRELAIFRTIYGPQHKFTAKAMTGLGMVWMEKGQYRQAETMLRDALAIYAHAIPGGSLEMATAQVQLGRILLRQKHYREAQPYTLAGYEVIKKQANPSIESLKAARSDLVRIYQALGEPDKAARVQAELVRDRAGKR